ncbi:DUF5325 family protein [Gorillibacterium massiliense]|uniref:DUF5325 family protein n=1 Tax=Gorillibacterium massiliense TaxID=1280390 RepID=UPI0004BB551C|nr:DUF5325 family protein [Gorillibacterium massiliense]
MKPIAALAYSIVGVLLMLSVTFAMSFEKPLVALALGIAAILYIGAGFIIKARMQRKLPPTE